VGTLALVGRVVDTMPRKCRRIPPLVIYLGMGWLVLFALEPLIATLPSAGF
jgi:hemolysin III